MLFHITQTQLKQFELDTQIARMEWKATLKRLPIQERNILENIIWAENAKAAQRRRK